MQQKERKENLFTVLFKCYGHQPFAADLTLIFARMLSSSSCIIYIVCLDVWCFYAYVIFVLRVRFL